MGIWLQKRASAFLLPTLLLLTSCNNTSSSSSLNNTQILGGGTTDALDGVTLGGISAVSLSGGAATLSLNSSSDYLLVVNSTRTGSSMAVQLSPSASVPSKSAPAALTTSESEAPRSNPEEFHEYMREMETVLPYTETSLGNEDPILSSVSALKNLLTVGSTQTFRSLSSLSSISSYATLTATLKYASSNLYVYVDNRNLANISDESINTLASDYETIAIPVERELYGSESDVNDDGHITILMTQVVNQLTSSGGLITGYFFPGDLFATSSTNPASNEQEIFYTLVPDSGGEYGVPISESFTVNNVLPGVLAHEYQHMISYNQKVFVQGGSTEEPWLNEALSHFTEDITGFGNENYARSRIFLANPSQISIASTSSPSLGERGGSYLFLRYLYEQSTDGPGFIHRLYTTADTGTNNIEQAFQGTSSFNEFSEFLNRWSIALALSETGLTTDARYNYQDRVLHPLTGNYTGTCIRCDTQDGRGTVLSGPTIQRVTSFPSSTSVSSASSQIFRLVSPSGSVNLTMGNTNGRAALIQLNAN